MTPGDDWFRQQGEDADLLHAISRIFDPHTNDPIGVAVSGGGDSMALLHLSARLARQIGRDVQAVTVDHGLRSEAADEAQQVADFSARLGISHDILFWSEPIAVSGNLQGRARAARYDLIARWAGDRGIATVLLGHTADDQAETFLMRLARKSGVDGLSCMADDFKRKGITFRRPLLLKQRAELRDYLSRRGVAWCDDPSNEDERFDRVRARKALRSLAEAGIGTNELLAVSVHMTAARTALDKWAREAAGRVVQQDRGDLIFAREAFDPLPPETRRRLLLAALRWIGGGVYPQRSIALTELETLIQDRSRMTLGGCVVSPVADTGFRVTREWSAVRDTVGRPDELWDRGRWQMTGPQAGGALIRALGDDGILQCPDWRESGLPRLSLLASPAIWHGDRLLAAPLAGLHNGWTAQLAKGRDIFVDSIGSH